MFEGHNFDNHLLTNKFQSMTLSPINLEDTTYMAPIFMVENFE